MLNLMPWIHRLALLILLCTQSAFADGGAFKRLVEDPTAANMPDQSALIAFSNGTETLAIETRFEGNSTDFAWVVPLPSVPQVAATSPGVFRTLPALFPRKVETQVTWLWGPALLLIVMCLAALSGSSLLRIAAVFFLIVGGFLIFLPSLGKARGMSEPTDSIQILNREVVGNFELTTISSKTPTDLTAWLTGQGFKVTPESAAAIADYVRDGWVFVAAKARRSASAGSIEPITPHPLVFTFTTPHAIYPMRLTGAGNTGPLSVDLYIFGSGTAQADGWKNRMSAPVTIVPKADTNAKTYAQSLPSAGEVTVSHSAIRDLVSNLPHATHLAATLSPAQMKRDVTISFGPPTETRYSVWTAESAIRRGFSFAAIVFSGLLLVSVFASLKKDIHLRTRLVCISLFLASATGVTTFFATPLAVATMSSYKYFHGDHYWALLATDNAIEKLRGARQPVNDKIIENVFLEKLTDHGFDLSHIKRGDSPGNYSIEKVGDFYQLRYYSISGQELMIIL